MRIYLVRHGETQWNKDARIQGQLDIGLSEIGMGQARLIAKRLADVPLDAIYSSDLSRALVTARTIAGPHGMEVTLAPEFREINFGEYQGKNWKEIDALYPGARESFRDPLHARAPGGESWPEVADRVESGLNRLASEWGDTGNLVVVSHGGTGRMSICRILGIDLSNRWKIRMDNTGISILEFERGQWSVGCINDTCHLSGGLSTGADD